MWGCLLSRAAGSELPPTTGRTGPQGCLPTGSWGINAEMPVAGVRCCAELLGLLPIM